MCITAKRNPLLSALVAAASVLTADIALAQVQVIEEVVVTARKRAESMQDVPMAVSAFNTQQLQDAQVNNITDLQKMTPNITVNETSGLLSGNVQVFIRGIGNDPGFDQGVGIYVDDVYLNRTSGALLEVYDVARIEVLKGPQGNLYGRNTIGGAIKYVSREPGDEFEAGLEAKVGSDELVKIKGNISGPLVDGRLFGGIGFLAQERDGYQTNRFDGSEWADADSWAARGTLLWQATDALSVKLVADYNKDESRGGIPNRVAIDEAFIIAISDRITGANDIYGPGTAILDTASDISMPVDEDDVNTAHLFPGFNVAEIETKSLAGTVTWDINDAWTLKSVTAYRELDNPRAFDFDGSDQFFIENTFPELESEEFSQELQLNFSGDTVNAVMGLYYLDGSFSAASEIDTSTRLRFYSDHKSATYRDDRDLESISAYANVEWNFAENWQLSIGGRYTEDEKDQDIRAFAEETFYPFAFTIAPGVDILGIGEGSEELVESHPQFVTWFPNDLAQSLIDSGVPTDPPLTSSLITRVTTTTYPVDLVANGKWDDFSPSVKLTHHLGDDTMVYGGFASGFKSGGFASDGSLALPYEPEIVDSYSLGLKTTLLEGSLRLNAELFYNDYEDKQLSTIEVSEDGEIRNTIDNVGSVESFGGEVEILWLPPVDGLTVNLNVGYLDSEVDEYLEANEEGEIVDVSDDRELGFAPEWTAQGRISYEFGIGNAGTLLISGDVAYRDEMYTDSPIDTTDEFRTQALSDSLTTYNALVAFTTEDQKWRVALEGKNLSDERELVNTFTLINYMLGGYNRERTWALSVAYTY